GSSGCPPVGVGSAPPAPPRCSAPPELGFGGECARPPRPSAGPAPPSSASGAPPAPTSAAPPSVLPPIEVPDAAPPEPAGVSSPSSGRKTSVSLGPLQWTSNQRHGSARLINPRSEMLSWHFTHGFRAHRTNSRRSNVF